MLKIDTVVDWNRAKKIVQKRAIESMSHELIFVEFEDDLKRLALCKILVLNRVLPNVIKSPDEHIKKVLCKLIKKWMEDDSVNHFNWTRSRMMQFPKKYICVIQIIGEVLAS